MNKLLPFLAFAIFALVACSEDKPESTHSELCATIPVVKKCLVGRWYLDRVEKANSLCDPNKETENYLKFTKKGNFSFKGGYQNLILETNGDWELNETGMKIDCESGDCIEGIYPIDATVEVLRSGAELRISNTKSHSSFLQCGVPGSIEVYTWQGNN
ncbi:MAG: hypothetical protein LBC75_08715 [Fibromonadaceae bacterium]|jgi:hypothetical protein|nr:hypothetical protein [Fibromonadaceae bacterium]